MSFKEYGIVKITEIDELELKGYLYQLLSFVDKNKRSFLQLAADVSDHMVKNKLCSVKDLSKEQVVSILNHFVIMPNQLYVYSKGRRANYKGKTPNTKKYADELEELPTFFTFPLEIKSSLGSFLVMYHAAGEHLIFKRKCKQYQYPINKITSPLDKSDKK